MYNNLYKMDDTESKIEDEKVDVKETKKVANMDDYSKILL